MVLADGRVLTRCDQCQQMYAERIPPGTPPCDNCRVEPKEENADALMIFFLVQNQFIMGANGPIDINHLAIHSAMDLYEVKDRRECFKKVLRLARWHINRIMEKNENG